MKSDSNNKPSKNYAYIDSQNLNMTIQNLGWSVDWAKFREYLYTKHNVAVAYLFIGYIAENQELYSFLQKAGFVIIFKPVVTSKDGTVKGNIDAELVLQVMLDQAQYDKAVVVTGDGDFHGLINHLYAQNKLEALLVPNMRQYSQLLKGAARERIDFISNMRRELEYKKRSQRSNYPSEPIDPAKLAPTPESASADSLATAIATGKPVAAAPSAPTTETITPASSALSRSNAPSRPNPTRGNSSPNRSGGRRRSVQGNLEDALMKTIDAGPQKPLATDGLTDVPAASANDKPTSKA